MTVWPDPNPSRRESLIAAEEKCNGAGTLTGLGAG